MGKRKKNRESDGYLLRKIRRLEKKILDRRITRDSDTSIDSEKESVEEKNSQSDHEIVDIESNEIHDPLIPTAISDTMAVPVSENDNNLTEPEVTIDENILALLGDFPKEDAPVGKDIHKDIAARFQYILQQGLKKEDKQKIKEDYPIPGNCLLFKAPILNAEIKAAVSHALYKKDLQFMERQSQVSVALSALTNAIQTLASSTCDINQTVIKYVSDASKILCDIHNTDTRLRRNFMLSTLNDKLKDTLKDAKRDNFLFGEDLAEKLKTNKAIQKSSLDLKAFQPKHNSAKTNPQPTTSNLNWKRPQSKSQMKNRKPTSVVHRTAGRTSMPQEPAHRQSSRNVSRDNVPYKTRKA